MMLFAIYGLMFGSIAIIGLASYPPLAQRGNVYLQRRVDEAKDYLEDMFLDLSHHQLRRLHVIAPICLGLVGFILTRQWIIAIAFACAGPLVPRLLMKHMDRTRRKKFHKQLVDCLLLLSSCLRAGLSVQQSYTVVAEEMPPPISQEFGLMLKEIRMGVGMDEAMIHFRQRMPSDDLNLFVTAILVARETGGDITTIFTRLVETLRERNKIRERIKTLTFMAKMQALLMACLPFAFSFVIYTSDKSHFDFFLTDPTGKMLLAGVILVQLFGGFLFLRFSRSPL